MSRTNTYVVELYAPPFPEKGRFIRAHRVWNRPFNLDLLSPNMIERWTVRAESKDAAVGDVVNWLRQK